MVRAGGHHCRIEAARLMLPCECRSCACSLYWGSGKRNGNYYNGLYRDYRVDIRVLLA